MYPDNNQSPQQQYSIDYLNQIAPQTPKRGMSSKWLVWVAIGGIIVALFVVMAMIISSVNAPAAKLQTLTARLLTLEKISKAAKKTIKSNALANTNSNLSIFLTNANRDIVTPMKNNNIDVKNLDKSITTKESGAELTKSLEDARLNALYDRTYAREMAYQLSTVKALMTEIYKGSGSKSLKDYMITTNKNLDPLQKEFSEFSAANS